MLFSYNLFMEYLTGQLKSFELHSASYFVLILNIYIRKGKHNIHIGGVKLAWRVKLLLRWPSLRNLGAMAPLLKPKWLLTGKILSSLTARFF